MQDEIVARLANALNAQLIAAEALRAEQARNPDSMDLYFRALGTIRARPRTLWRRRAKFFDRALAADPDNVDALVRSAGADFIMVASLLVTYPKEAFAVAEAKLTKALSSVPDHARGHMLLGMVEMLDQARGGGRRQM